MLSFAKDLFEDMKREIMSLGRDCYTLPRTYRKVEDAKKRGRPELTKFGWDTLNYADNLNLPQIKDNIDRLDGQSLSVAEFRRLYERPRIPCILTGLTEGWQANEKWTLMRLAKKYRNQKFRCGEDNNGFSVRLKMKYYHDYMINTRDDSPLYIFDGSCFDREKTNKLLEDFEVPKFFKDDLYNYADMTRRPPHRWFVLGPARSGTACHIDPLGTSAWNTLVRGHKRWVLIPPEAPKELVKPMAHEKGKHGDEGVQWFNTVYRRVKSPSWPKEFAPIECRQGPGDTIFVPSGWWHVVMNEDDAIAVTQNFCSVENLHLVWPKTYRGRPKLSRHWFKRLKRERPEVLGIIKATMETGFVDPNESSSDSSSDSSSSSSGDDDDSSDDEMGIGRMSGGRKRKMDQTATSSSSDPKQAKNEEELLVSFA